MAFFTPIRRRKLKFYMEVQRAQIIEVTKKNNTGLVTISDLSYPTESLRKTAWYTETDTWINGMTQKTQM